MTENGEIVAADGLGQGWWHCDVVGVVAVAVLGVTGFAMECAVVMEAVEIVSPVTISS